VYLHQAGRYAHAQHALLPEPRQQRTQQEGLNHQTAGAQGHEHMGLQGAGDERGRRGCFAEHRDGHKEGGISNAACAKLSQG